MNQILFIKIEKNKYKKIFKIQLVVSLISIIIILIYFINNYINEKKFENISSIINNNLKLSSIYEINKIKTEESLYFGKIIIEKINLENVVFNKYSEELLKISPCKFYGGKFEEKGNICIAGHNYNDNRFFSRLDELELKDIIKLIDVNGKFYEYQIYEIYETDEDDLNPLKSKKDYELTLITCDNLNNKRIIIKAFRI